MSKKKVVVALGHRALGTTMPEQYKATRNTAKAIADLVEAGADVVISHSNAPQVGMIHTAMNEFSKEREDYTQAPMSVCSAMSQGYVGYDLQNAIRAELLKRGVYRPVCTIITQVMVDPYDDAFTEPVKVIGRLLSKEEAEQEEKERKKQAEKLKLSILNDKDVFGDLSIDKSTRQKIYDNIAKPVYKDPETGEYFTAIQKYEMENRTDFLKNIGLLFTLTDGFKNLDGLVKGKVKKEVKKGLRELEHTLNNTARTSDGNLKFVSGVDEDPESFIGKGWNLDV